MSLAQKAPRPVRSRSRDQLIQQVFALRPVMQRRFTAEFHRELHEELQQVTVHQLSVLELLRRAPLSMREIARCLSVGESSATAAADRLVRQGLVQRLDDPDDRRVVRLELTEAGHELVGRVEQAASRKTSLMLAALSDEQLRQLVDILETLRDSAVSPCDDKAAK